MLMRLRLKAQTACALHYSLLIYVTEVLAGVRIGRYNGADVQSAVVRFLGVLRPRSTGGRPPLTQGFRCDYIVIS